MPEMPEILAKAVAAGASDILIVPEEPPVMRVDGRIRKMEGFAVVTPAEAKRLIYTVLGPRHTAIFEKNGEVDLPVNIPGLMRFRTNVFLQHKGIACAMRPLANTIPTPEELSLNPTILSFCDVPRGLVVVTGPTGSGKTTTLASMIEHINKKYSKHIITIEDPIEYAYQNKECVIDQREVGTHTMSFANALRSAVREDPDIILVGEMRDLETIELAIRAAETGHLCFSTLHTKDAVSSIDRVVNEFPADQQPKIKLALSSVLIGVVSQCLVPKVGGGRICAREIMLMDSSIGTMIRENKVHQLPGAIQAAKASGMCTMEQSLAELVMHKKITRETARANASDLNSLGQILNQLAIPDEAEVLK